jgi:hypothetical protein
MMHQVLRGLRQLALGAAMLSASSPVLLLSQESAASRHALTAEQWREDLRVMMEELPKRHAALYHTTPRATFDSAARALHAHIPQLARHQIILGMQRIVALAGDGHTNIYPSRDAAIAFRTLPIALYIFKDGLHVRAADRAHADLAGGRVVRIGEASADQAYQRVRPYIGRDNEMGARFWAPYLLAMPEVLHAIELAPSPDSARFEVETGGRRRTVWLRPVGPAPLMAGDADRSWRPKAGWVDARDGAAAPVPLWLRSAPDTVLWWFTPIPDARAVYVQVNQVRDAPTETMEAFTQRLLAYLDTASVDRLVLDLRLNRGGNGGLRLPLVRGLLRQPKVNTHGRFFVLMGRATFSAAQFVLDDLDKYSEAVFVGEPSGSRGNHYGDSRQTRLPNSGITVRASTIYWQDWSPNDPRPWTAPDVAAELTLADYQAHQDPALAATIAYLPRVPLSVDLQRAVAADDTAGARARLRAFRADPAHLYVDAHQAIDEAALHLYRRQDRVRATWLFALAAEAYPYAVRAHRNLAVLYREMGQPDLERRALERVVTLDPRDEVSAARLRTLQPPT